MSRFSEKRLAEDIVKTIQEHSPLRRRRVMAVALVTFALGAIGNFVFSKVEIAAVLWFLTLFALADLLLTFGNLSRITRWRRLGLDAGLVLIISALSAPLLYGQYCSQHAALTSGVLHAIDDGKDYSQKAPFIEVGESGGGFIWAGPDNKPIFKQWADKLAIRRVRNDLLVSMTMRDQLGKLIVEVKDNHWRVSSSPTECWDKNYSRDSLEVKDGRGRVVLQLRILPDKVQLQVEWPDHSNTISDHGKYDEEDGIRPRFKYPSSEHWGELDPDTGYSTSALHSWNGN